MEKCKYYWRNMEEKYWSNQNLLNRNILREYIKNDNKSRKRSGTKTAFIKSQKDYNKRRQLNKR